MRLKDLFLALFLALFLSALATPGRAAELHISPAGNDNAPGTAAQPLATLAAAREAARPFAGREPVTIILHGGTYYLPGTFQLTSADSGTAQFPVTYTAAPGETPVLSGGLKLNLTWTPLSNGIFQARTPAGLTLDQLFINGRLQPMARYPNYDPAAAHYNGTAADAISPERVARWSDPAGGYVHAMHSALWGDMHWRILGKNHDGTLSLEGGWQNNRPSAMHKKFRYVENIREELDAPGEWFHDAKAGLLYYLPAPGVNPATARVEGVRLRHLIEFNGTPAQPVKFITLRGLTFRHAARTFMDNREPLLRTDWTVYRGGALVFHGAEDDTVTGCDFDQLGGNTIFVNDYNRRLTFSDCLIQDSGGNGIAFVGNPAAARNGITWHGANDYATLDRTPGPLTDDYPADCLVENCLITRIGRCEKQTAGVEIDLARRITVRHCSIYDVPRAGVNIGDGCWGGQVIEDCDIFDTVLETGDHGSFNAWGRDRYWELRGVTPGELPALALLDVVEPNTLRHNRWRCDHGWDIDLDDGSSNYRIYDNLLLHGGLKLREGFQRIATNNVIVNNTFHLHVWFPHSGDVIAHNIVMDAYRPIGMKAGQWGAEIDRNLFTTDDADRRKYLAHGCDANSLAGDAQFINPATADFRVQPGSPALQVGFVNFPMDNFGVQSPRLKPLARTPVIPALEIHAAGADTGSAATISWRGASLREMVGEEFSVIGVPADSRGILLPDVPEKSAAYQAGLRPGDFITRVGSRTIFGVKDFLAQAAGPDAVSPLRLTLLRNQKTLTVTLTQ